MVSIRWAETHKCEYNGNDDIRIVEYVNEEAQTNSQGRQKTGSPLSVLSDADFDHVKIPLEYREILRTKVFNESQLEGFKSRISEESFYFLGQILLGEDVESARSDYDVLSSSEHYLPKRQQDAAVSIRKEAQNILDSASNMMESLSEAVSRIEENQSEIRKAVDSMNSTEKEPDEPVKQQILIGVLLLSSLLVVALVLFGIRYFNRGSAEESTKEKKTIITLDEVAKYCDKNEVYVEYTVGYIGESKYYVFLNPEMYPDFSVLIPSKKLTKEDAKKVFLGERVRVYGKIALYKYEDNNKEIYEIIVSDLKNISVVD